MNCPNCTHDATAHMKGSSFGCTWNNVVAYRDANGKQRFDSVPCRCRWSWEQLMVRQTLLAENYNENSDRSATLG